MTRSRGGRVAPHKFGRGFLLGAWPMASKTSFVHMFMQFIYLCTPQPPDDRLSSEQFHPGRLIPATLVFVGAAARAATASNARMSGTHETQMAAGGR